MTPLRIIMLSYERGFLDPAPAYRQAGSEASGRLAAMTSEDVRVTAVVLSRAPRFSCDDERPHTRVLGLPGNPAERFFRALRAAHTEVKRARKAGERVVLTAQDPFAAGLVAFITSRRRDVPYEIQEHADYFSGAWAREVPVVHEALATVGKFILRRADGVRAVSDRVRDHLVAIGVEPERIAVIPVAQELSSISRGLNQHAGPASRVPTIIAPCRFVKQKGLDVLLHALAMLAEEDISFRLRLIGEGREGPKLAELASALGIRDCVIFESWSSPEVIWNDADLFVLSSRYEGWGRTIVEAMAAGVPVVTTDVGCVGSLFRPQVDGRVVPPGDASALASAIREQLTEPDRREWMVQNARERVNTFPVQKMCIERQRDAWRRVMAANGSPRTESDARTVRGESGTRTVRGDHPPSSGLRGADGSRGLRSAWKWTAVVIGFVILVHGASVALFWPTLGAHREWGFFTLVQHWFQGYGYSFASEPGCLSAQRAPGYLFFLTAVYGLFGFANFFAQAVVQNVMAVVLAYLVYRLAWRVSHDRRVGWIAAVVATLHPYAFYHDTQYYHTVLSGTFLAGLLLSFMALDRTQRLRWAWVTGVMTAALAYIQGTILVAMPFLALWLVWRWKARWKRAVLAVGIIAVVSVGLIAPWTIRNWQAFHAFVPLTTDLGFAAYKANTENYETLLRLGFPHEALMAIPEPENPDLVRYRYLPEVETALQEAGGVKDAAFWTQSHPREPVRVSDTCAGLSTVSEAEDNQYWMGLAREWYVNHFWPDGVRLQLRKAATFWSPVLYPWVRYGASWPFGNEGMIALLAVWSLAGYVSLLELTAFAGLVVLIRRKRAGLVVPILIVFAAYTLLHTFFAPYTKYRIPLDSLLAVLSAMSLFWAWRYFVDRIRTRKSLDR